MNQAQEQLLRRLTQEQKRRERLGQVTKQSTRRAKRFMDVTIAKARAAHEERERDAGRKFRGQAEENIERLLHASRH